MVNRLLCHSVVLISDSVMAGIYPCSQQKGRVEPCVDSGTLGCAPTLTRTPRAAAAVSLWPLPPELGHHVHSGPF